MKELSEKEALYKAAALCSGAEYCAFDIALKLRKWGMAEDIIEHILKQLVEENYLNEARFARAYTLDKWRYNQWGRVKITQMLRQKKIPVNTIEGALNEIDEEEYQSILSELMREKEKKTTGKTSYERWCKLVKFALSKGFEMSVITSVYPFDGDL